MPIWLDIINSDHDYSRDKYVAQITTILDHPKLGGIMLYGLDNETLSLKQRYEWFVSIQTLLKDK
jgi:hypothetical protein